MLEFQLFLNAIYYGDLIIILMIKHKFSELWKSLQEIKFQDTGSLETYCLFNQTHSEVASIKCYLHDSHSDNQFWNYKSALTFWGLLEKVFIIFLNQKMNLFFNFICSLPLQVSLAASQITWGWTIKNISCLEISY